MEENEKQENQNTAENKNVEGAGNVDTQTTEKNEGQAEIDVKAEAQKIADAMVAKKMKGMPSKEELKAFKDWQESQKTAEQKQAEKDAEYKEKDTKISELEKENAVLKAGVTDADDIDYILFKVGKMEGEFEENLVKFLKDNPKYLEKELEKEELKATGAPVRTVSSKKDGVLSILASKHPEINFD